MTEVLFACFSRVIFLPHICSFNTFRFITDDASRRQISWRPVILQLISKHICQDCDMMPDNSRELDSLTPTTHLVQVDPRVR